VIFQSLDGYAACVLSKKGRSTDKPDKHRFQDNAVTPQAISQARSAICAYLAYLVRPEGAV